MGGFLSGLWRDAASRVEAAVGRVVARFSGGMAGAGDGRSDFKPESFVEDDWDDLFFGTPSGSAAAWSRFSQGMVGAGRLASPEAAWIWGHEMDGGSRAAAWRSFDPPTVEALMTGGFGCVHGMLPGRSEERVADRALRIGALFWWRPAGLIQEAPGPDDDGRLWHMGVWASHGRRPDFPVFPSVRYPEALSRVLMERAEGGIQAAKALLSMEGDPCLERPLARTVMFSSLIIVGFWVGTTGFLDSTLGPSPWSWWMAAAWLAAGLPGLAFLVPWTRRRMGAALFEWSLDSAGAWRVMEAMGGCPDWPAGMGLAMARRREWLAGMASDQDVLALVEAGGMPVARAVSIVEMARAGVFTRDPGCEARGLLGEAGSREQMDELDASVAGGAESSGRGAPSV